MMEAVNKVDKSHIKALFPDLHRSLLDIVSAMNRPQIDQAMLAMGRLDLEPALFTPLVLVAKLGHRHLARSLLNY
jgi:hypothetical protein